MADKTDPTIEQVYFVCETLANAVKLLAIKYGEPLDPDSRQGVTLSMTTDDEPVVVQMPAGYAWEIAGRGLVMWHEKIAGKRYADSS